MRAGRGEGLLEILRWSPPISAAARMGSRILWTHVRQPPRGVVERRRGLGREAADELAGRQLLGERVGLSGPQVEAPGVALLARCRPQRRGQVVNLRVGGGRVARV